jgi:transposase
VPLYGWGLKNQRLIGKVTGKRAKRTNCVSAVCNGKKLSPYLFEGSCKTNIFIDYLEKTLLPDLKKFEKPKIIIMDNASFHKSPAIKKLIEDAGHRLMFLPPYSPTLNPQERIWGNLKQYIRKFLKKCECCIKYLILNFFGINN